MIIVADWLMETFGWEIRGADRPRGLIRSARQSVVKSEGRGTFRRMITWETVSLSRRTDADPAGSSVASEVKPDRHIRTDVPSQTDAADRSGQAMEPSSGTEDPERDRALMRLVCEHDEEALAALYDCYAALVNGLALSILHVPALAEEATHDVFLRIWQQPTAYDPARGSFAGWLLRVARNRSIDLLRRRREDPIGMLEADGALWIVDPAPGPEEETMTQLRRQEVRRALDELAPDQRRLLELAYFTGLSQSQIANLLGRPLGTVKSQIRSAMLRLAERLGPPDHLSSPPTSRTLPTSSDKS